MNNTSIISKNLEHFYLFFDQKYSQPNILKIFNSLPGCPSPTDSEVNRKWSPVLPSIWPIPATAIPLTDSGMLQGKIKSFSFCRLLLDLRYHKCNVLFYYM